MRICLDTAAAAGNDMGDGPSSGDCEDGEVILSGMQVSVAV